MTDAPTDADTEAGRGEGRDLAEWLDEAAGELEAEVRDRYHADHPDGVHPAQQSKYDHGMRLVKKVREAARRLRESDPDGEPVAWRYKYDDKPGWHFRISEIDLPGPILSGRWDDVTVEALYAGEPDFADRTTTPDPPSEAEPGWQRTCLDCGEEMRVYKSDPHTCGACDSHNVVNSHPEVSASPPVEEGERGEAESWALQEPEGAASVLRDIADRLDEAGQILRAPDARQGEGDVDCTCNPPAYLHSSDCPMAGETLTGSPIFDAIRAERERQDAKWGTSFPDRDWDRWLTILVEEVGEFAEAVLEMPYEGSEEAVRKELVQVAAVAVSALEFGAPQGSQRGAGGDGLRSTPQGEGPDCYLKVWPEEGHEVLYVACEAGEPWMSEDGMMVEVTPWGWARAITVHANRTVHEPHAPNDARVVRRAERATPGGGEVGGVPLAQQDDYDRDLLLALDDYKAESLAWLLRQARGTPLDTGDWCGVLLRVLEEAGYSAEEDERIVVGRAPQGEGDTTPVKLHHSDVAAYILEGPDGPVSRDEALRSLYKLRELALPGRAPRGDDEMRIRAAFISGATWMRGAARRGETTDLSSVKEAAREEARRLRSTPQGESDATAD